MSISYVTFYIFPCPIVQGSEIAFNMNILTIFLTEWLLNLFPIIYQSEGKHLQHDRHTIYMTYSFSGLAWRIKPKVLECITISHL